MMDLQYLNISTPVIKKSRRRMRFLFIGCFQINELWKNLRDFLQKPSQYQEECQKPKAVLLSSGEMFKPYAWAVGTEL